MSNKLVIIITYFCLSVVLLISVSFVMIHNLNYYDRKYEQYNIYEIFQKDVAINSTKNILGFFENNNELDSEFFKPNEISHLQDVKDFLNVLRLVLIVSTMIVLGYVVFNFIQGNKVIRELLFYSGIITISLFLLFGLIYLLFGFDFLFEHFHKIFFVDNYAFDPRISNMKALFPNAFFQDFMFDIILRINLVALVFVIVGKIIKKTQEN